MGRDHCEPKTGPLIESPKRADSVAPYSGNVATADATCGRGSEQPAPATLQMSAAMRILPRIDRAFSILENFPPRPRRGKSERGLFRKGSIDSVPAPSNGMVHAWRQAPTASIHSELAPAIVSISTG